MRQNEADSVEFTTKKINYYYKGNIPNNCIVPMAAPSSKLAVFLRLVSAIFHVVFQGNIR